MEKVNRKRKSFTWFFRIGGAPAQRREFSLIDINWREAPPYF
jgi:hypothetical protein